MMPKGQQEITVYGNVFETLNQTTEKHRKLEILDRGYNLHGYFDAH